MKIKINPFKPNHPIYSGLFAGRIAEINKIEEALNQTKHGNPTNLLFIGERGIGKTSLLLLSKYMAQGDIEWSDNTHNFVPIHLAINQKSSLLEFAIKFRNSLKRELHKLNNTKKIIDSCWGFLKNIEVAGVKIKDDKQLNAELYIDDFIYSLADTIDALTKDGEQKKDGLVVIIDEGDTASSELDIGTFLKNLTESLSFEDKNKILFIIAGLPQVTDKLRESHESSLRLFEEYKLKPLTSDDVKDVIKSAIKTINDSELELELIIEPEALTAFYEYSEGYPHFLQQIGYTLISKLDSETITSKNVIDAMFQPGGALELIGRRYYVDLFYNKINSDMYRQILTIMAERWNEWITKEEIRKKFTGSGSNLNNGIKALRDRNIILTKRGVRGHYRLQWLSFAFWIKIHKDKPK